VKFGFGHVPAEDHRRHVRLVQVAEELGFDYAWIPDQTFHRDPVALIAAVAPATRRIRLGLGVANPYTRHPAMLARAAATLDEMAEGRFNVGIGAGNRKELLQPLGLDDGDAARRCREMAEMVRALLAGGRAEYRGTYFRAAGVALDFPARPGLEIYIAGRGPNVLAAAGAVADGVIVGGLCTAPGIGYALEQIRRGANRAGRDAPSQVVSWVTCQLTQDRTAAVRQLKPVVAHIIGGAPMAVLQAAGLPGDLMERIKATYRERGIPEAAELVTRQCVDAFTIVGDAEECAERIAALEGWGVTQFSVLMPPGSVEQHEARLRAFAKAIIPLVAGQTAGRSGGG
jgi:5,10-methylenetetrahydromethanopterin reductase